jgi:hypothetical protein
MYTRVPVFDGAPRYAVLLRMNAFCAISITLSHGTSRPYAISGLARYDQ